MIKPIDWVERWVPASGVGLGQSRRHGIAILAAVTFSMAVQAQVSAPRGLNRVGPLNQVHQFPEWYQDQTGLALEFGTPLTQGELDGGWVLLLPGDTVAPENYVYPPLSPTTFFDEHFYWHANVLGDIEIPAGVDPTIPANQTTTAKILVEFGHEAAFSSGALEVPGDQVVFTRIRIKLNMVPESGDYVLETPYKNYSFSGLVAGDRLFFTDDYGVAKMPQGYVESLSGPIGPYLVPADAPGGNELPPVIFEGRAYIADPTLAYPVTGSPLGQNHVRLIGPGGRQVYFTNQFSMTGRIKTGAIPSSVAVERASRYDAPDDRRLSIFAKGYPTLQTRLPGQPYALRTHPTVDVFLGPPGMGPAGELTVPLDLPALRMADNGPFGISYFLETPITGLFPAAVTARDDGGFVSSVPVSDSVFVTKADYSAANQMLTVAAVTADISAPASFSLRGVDGIDGASSLFSSSIDILNLLAPPATVTVVSAAGGAATVNVTTGVPSLAQNTPPIALDDSAVSQGTTPIRINVLQNDRDPDGDRLTIDSVTQPAGGTVAIGDLGTSLTFTANPGVRGLQTFQYNVSDRRGGLVTANVTVDVNALPLAAPDTLIATTGESLVLDVLANDTDPDGDTLTVTAVTQPVVGSVQVGTVSIVAGGSQIAYLANAGSTGVHLFTYTISDGRGASATATVQATINTPPVAQADTVIDVDRQAVLVNVLGNDTDADGDTIQLASVGTNPRATIEIIGTSVRFTPLAEVLPVETFTYVILDGRGGRGRAGAQDPGWRRHRGAMSPACARACRPAGIRAMRWFAKAH